MLNIIQTRSYTNRLRRVPNNYCSGFEESQEKTSRLGAQEETPSWNESKRRLTSRFERIENIKNFDVEKWYNFNFLFRRKL
jgi:hypothetical protein